MSKQKESKRIRKSREARLIKESVDFLIPNGTESEKLTLSEFIKNQLENINCCAVTAGLPGVRESLSRNILWKMDAREIIITEGRTILKSRHYVNSPI